MAARAMNFGWVVSLADRQGDTVRLPVVPLGEFVYKGKVLTITEEEANTIAAETMRLFDTVDQHAISGASSWGKVTPWRPPVIREHVPEGRSWGRVVEVESDKGVWATVEFTESTWQEIERNEVQWFSPKLVPGYVDQWGNVYKRVILEVSLTTNPKLKHIGRVQDFIQLSEGLIMEEEETQGGAAEGTVETNEDEGSGDLETRLATLEELVAKLIEKMDAKPAPAEMKDGEDVTALSDNLNELKTSIVALSDKIDSIRGQGRAPLTKERGNAGPDPSPKNREAELIKQGYTGSDLAAKLLWG